jgi:hypothetical protein
MRLAIVGNSHLAALKVAVREGLFKQADVALTFWGIAGPGFDSITFDNGNFRTPNQDFVLRVSDGRYGALPAHEFDAMVFHGPPLNMTHLLASLRKIGDLQCYTHDYLRAGLRAYIEETSAWQLVSSLRADYDGPVLLSPMPLPSEDSARVAPRPLRSEELTLLNTCIATMLRDYGIEYIQQPSITVRDYSYTKREFCVNSVRLSDDLAVKHPTDDFVHMNGRYGAHVLRDIVSQLSVRPACAAQNSCSD